MENFGISEKLVKPITMCNNSNTSCKIRFRGEMSPEFEVKVGLQQGDAVSPISFDVVLEKVIRDVAKRRCTELDRNTILGRADGLIILSSNILSVLIQNDYEYVLLKTDIFAHS